MAEHEAEHIDVDPQPLAAIWGMNQIIFVYMTGIGILVAMAALTLLF